MRIIKMGNINKYIHTCPYCSCEYEYDDTDMSVGYEYASTGRYSYVVCPCCHNLNRIDSYRFKYKEPYPYFDPLTRYNYINCISDKEIFSQDTTVNTTFIMEADNSEQSKNGRE